MRYRRVRVEGGTYFFTVVTYQRRPIFADAAMVDLLHRSIEKVQARHPFEIIAQVILPDHLHAIWTLPAGDADYSKRWRLIKESVTRELNNVHEMSVDQPSSGKGHVWQKRFREHVIRDDNDLAAHVDYIHFNPVHHGLVNAPRDWPHSTFLAWVERSVYPLDWGGDVLPVLPEWSKPFE